MLLTRLGADVALSEQVQITVDKTVDYGLGEDIRGPASQASMRKDAASPV